MEAKLKHLEFIQNVITRMSSNSFLIKGWSITLIAAIFALAAKDSNSNFIYIIYLVLPAFWILDGFFISQERQYRKLYQDTSLKINDEIDFCMKPSEAHLKENGWLKGIFSKTLLCFYGLLSLTIALVTIQIGC